MKNRMKIEYVSDKGYFFNAEQKEVKQKIMHEIMDVIFSNLHANKDLFDLQETLDLFYSILVFVNRDLLLHMILATGVLHLKKDIIQGLFANVEKEINEAVKRIIM